MSPTPATASVWDDNVPLSAQSADGVNMVLYIPNFIVRITFVSIYRLLLIVLVAHHFGGPYTLQQI